MNATAEPTTDAAITQRPAAVPILNPGSLIPGGTYRRAPSLPPMRRRATNGEVIARTSAP